MDAVFGFILNVPTRSFFGLIPSGQHWVAVRRISGVWYNLDSKLSAPAPIDDILAFLRAAVADARAQLLVVIPETAAPNSIYLPATTQPAAGATDGKSAQLESKAPSREQEAVSGLADSLQTLRVSGDGGTAGQRTGATAADNGNDGGESAASSG